MNEQLFFLVEYTSTNIPQCYRPVRIRVYYNHEQAEQAKIDSKYELADIQRYEYLRKYYDEIEIMQLITNKYLLYGKDNDK